MSNYFAGLDWASKTHALCVVDEHGSVVERAEIAHAWAASVYAKAKARGCTHPHAIRILARAWLRVIWRAWTDRKTYQPAQYRASQLLLNTQAD